MKSTIHLQGEQYKTYKSFGKMYENSVQNELCHPLDERGYTVVKY
jgi:hypothetical protein